MPKILKEITPLLCAAFVFAGTSCKQEKTPADWVNPNIGGIAPLLTTVTPQVQRPNSMVRVWPVTEPSLSDRYLSDYIYGIIFNMPRYRLGYTSSIMATSGELRTAPKDIRSWYDHSLEEVHPWYHRVFLQDWGIDAEWTCTERTVDYRFIFPLDKQSNVIFRFENAHDVVFNEDGSISGWEKISQNKQYFHIVPSRRFEKTDMFDKGFFLSDAEDHSPAEFKVGISFVSTDQAKANLEKESLCKSFESIRDEGRAIWDNELSRIMVEGGTPEQKELFYTCFYRASERMVNISEDGGSMSSWYMFAAMGFFPTNPVSGEYALASPMFSKVTINLEDGKKFVIEAPGASGDYKYVKKVSLNGKRLTRPFISHSDIISGGVLCFELSKTPCPDCYDYSF